MIRRNIGSARLYSTGAVFSNALTPREILGLTLWLCAALGITIGTGVSTWADQSGGTHNFTQATGGNQPAWSAASGANGQAGVTFDGSSSKMVGPASSAILANASSHIFAVVNPVAIARNVAAPNAWQNDGLFSDQSGWWGMFLRNTGGGALDAFAFDSGAVERIAEVSGVTVGSDQLLEYRVDGTSVIGKHAANAEVATGCDHINSLASTATIGAGVSNRYGHFVLSDLIAFNVTLSATDARRVRWYEHVRYAA